MAALVAIVAAAGIVEGCGGSTRKDLGATGFRAYPLTIPQLPPQPVSTSDHPNIVFVLTDDLAWNLVQYMPHVQQMQRDGLTFSNYFVTDSLCCPSRASIFTGRYPHDTGVYKNNGPDGGFHVFFDRGEEDQTFATMLQAQGYRTGLMGKYLNGYTPARPEGTSGPYVPPGWNEWDVAGNGYPEFNYTLNENGSLVHYGRAPQDYLTDVVSGRAVDFIDRAASNRTPFMLELATFAPHSPFVPAPRNARDFPGLQVPRTPAFDVVGHDEPDWLKMYRPLSTRAITRLDEQFRRRAQSVEAVDAMIGRIEDELVAKGIAQNTYIVFSSDNGLHMGEHRLLAGKLSAFDTDIKVPLIVTGPGIPAGRQTTQLAENVDLAPTFADIGHAPVPLNVDGHSLVPLLHGQSADDWRNAVLVEHHGPELIPGDPDLPRHGAGNPPSYEAIRTAHAVYVEYDNGEREYYDLATDPFELNNLASRLPPAQLAMLHATLTAIVACHGGVACWSAEHGAPGLIAAGVHPRLHRPRRRR